MIETIQKIRAAFPNAVLNETFFRDEYSLTIAISSLRDICLHARDVLGFNYLIDVSSVDHFGEEPRFEMVYELYSMRDRIHLRLKATVSEDDCQAPTVSDIWPTADWHEREVYDMMGIRFVDHPDLRRILMWEGFPYHPLRKDFPLTGFVEVRYDDEEKRVVYEPVKLVQEFRNFDFLSPWEGTDYVLPGDEKAKN